MNLLAKSKFFLTEKILGIKDTPHRIAFGVFLGCLVGWTPTMGLQIAIYLALAALLRANKLSGIPMVFISNPFTAVPLYYTAWRFGQLLLHGHDVSVASNRYKTTLKKASGANEDTLDKIYKLLDPDYWPSIYESMVRLGVELWVGSLVLGVCMGIIGYAASYFVITRYRRNRQMEL